MAHGESLNERVSYGGKIVYMGNKVESKEEIIKLNHVYMKACRERR